MKSIPVVTSFIEKGDKLLIVKRSDEVGSFQGRWSAISGYLEGKDPLEQAKIEISQETDLDVEFVKKGNTTMARGEDNIWKVHPFLFKTQQEPVLNWENLEYRWVTKDELKELKTVPRLLEAYEEVKR
ncbi:MAG: NUDIX domain-containing protein [Thermoplasmatota archaeon]